MTAIDRLLWNGLLWLPRDFTLDVREALMQATILERMGQPAEGVIFCFNIRWAGRLVGTYQMRPSGYTGLPWDDIYWPGGPDVEYMSERTATNYFQEPVRYRDFEELANSL